MVSLGSSLTSQGIYLLTCGRRSLVLETQNEIVVSWITLTWLDFSQHFRSCCLPQVRAEACISLQASWEQVNSSNCLNHVRRTKSSIKKWIIVHRTVGSMFGEQTFAQLRMGFIVYTDGSVIKDQSWHMGLHCQEKCVHHPWRQ